MPVAAQEKKELTYDSQEVKQLQRELYEIVQDKCDGKWERAERLFGKSATFITNFCRGNYPLSPSCLLNVRNMISLSRLGLRGNGITRITDGIDQGFKADGDNGNWKSARPNLGIISSPAIQKIADEVASERARVRKIHGFYETRAVRFVWNVLDFLVANRSIGLIIGNTGYSKTESVEEYKRKADLEGKPVLVIKCEVNTTPKDLVSEIAGLLHVSSAGAVHRINQNIITVLRDLALHAEEPLLIIDEADTLSQRSLETLRYIHDSCKIQRDRYAFALALFGMPRLYHAIVNPRRDFQLQQLRRRMLSAEIPPLEADEVKGILKQEEWKIEDPAVTYLMNIIQGSFGIFAAILPQIDQIMARRKTDVITKELVRLGLQRLPGLFGRTQ